MILIDVNILVYASITGSSLHHAAKEWLDNQLNGPAPVGLPWMCVLGYLRLVTNARISKPPVPMAIAWQRVLDWFSATTVWIPAPTERHAEVLGGLLSLTESYFVNQLLLRIKQLPRLTSAED